MKSASAILFLVNFVLGRRVTTVYVFPGGSAGIQYSIEWSASGWNTPANIFKDDTTVGWSGDGSFRGDAIIIDLGGEQAVTGLEFRSHIYVDASGFVHREVKTARFHGSLANDGPWTLLLERSWDATVFERPTETRPISDTGIRFVKLEIVDAYGGPRWEYFRILTGSKAIMDVNIL